MKTVIRLEETAMFLLYVYALFLLKVEWWYYLLILIGPDISMIGYVAGNKIGAIIYNIFHHKGIAILFFGIGLFLNNELLQLIGMILFGHSSFDRMQGYGLKTFVGFKFTNLGEIGKKKVA